MRRTVKVGADTNGVVYSFLCPFQILGTIFSEGMIGIVTVRMVTYHMSISYDASGGFGVKLHVLADEEESRLDIIAGENIKDL